MLYAKVGTGYRAGGVNNGTFNPAAPNPSSRPMTTRTRSATNRHEVRASIPTSSVRLAAICRAPTMRSPSINDGCTLTNVVRHRAAVLQRQWRHDPCPRSRSGDRRPLPVGEGLLSIRLNAATQRAYFAKVPAGVAGLARSRSAVAQIPDWTMSAVIDYRQPIAENIARVHQCQLFGPARRHPGHRHIGDAGITLDDFDIFGARAGVEYRQGPDRRVRENFTDKRSRCSSSCRPASPLSVRYQQAAQPYSGISRIRLYRW